MELPCQPFHDMLTSLTSLYTMEKPVYSCQGGGGLGIAVARPPFPPSALRDLGPKWLRTRPNGVNDDDDDVCGAADVAADDTYVRRYVMVPIVTMLVPMGLMMLIVMMIRTYVVLVILMVIMMLT